MENEIIRKIKLISEQPTHRFSFLAKYIVNNVNSISGLPIQQMASNAFTSVATVNRFCKSLALDGYRELLHIIKYYNENALSRPETVVDNQQASRLDGLLRIGRDNACIALDKTYQLLLKQQDMICRTVELISRARRINVFAVGGTYNMALDFIDKLLRLGLAVFSAGDFHKGYYLCQNATCNDLNIIISYSGETNDLLKLASILSANNSPILTVGKNHNSSLIKCGQYRLLIESEEKLLRTSSQTSRFALLFALDMLYNCLYQSNAQVYDLILKETAISKL